MLFNLFSFTLKDFEYILPYFYLNYIILFYFNFENRYKLKKEPFTLLNSPIFIFYASPNVINLKIRLNTDNCL